MFDVDRWCLVPVGVAVCQVNPWRDRRFTDQHTVLNTAVEEIVSTTSW